MKYYRKKERKLLLKPKAAINFKTNSSSSLIFISIMTGQNQNISSFNLDVLNKQISYQANTWSPISKEMTIKEALLEIQSNKYKQQVSKLRSILQSGQKDEYTCHKRTLPAVTFCGTFDGERKKAKLKTYNSVIVLDIDKLDNSELSRCKDCFLNDHAVFSFWESPSKEGVKGIVFLHFNLEINTVNTDLLHKSAFQKLAKYFIESYNIKLDISGSDTTRLCFFSYDPAIVIKENIIPFEISEADLTKETKSQEKVSITKLTVLSRRDELYNPKDRNKPNDRYTISAIIKHLEKKKSSITHSYEEWFKVAMSIANSFTYDVGEKYFLKLSSLDKDKYNEINCKNFLINCYETKSGAVNFSTIVYFANGKAYKTKKQRKRGSEVVDENLSQVSSSNTVIRVHSPEDLKE